MLEEGPQPVEARPNTTTPSRNIARLPKESPSAPPTRIRAERKSPYDSTTHCTSSTVACSPDCSAGKATLTTVLSMNAMLEPRTVAASTHRFDFSAHATVGLPGRIPVSSQFGVILDP